MTTFLRLKPEATVSLLGPERLADLALAAGYPRTPQ
jgi:hypothetical protein